MDMGNDLYELTSLLDSDALNEDPSFGKAITECDGPPCQPVAKLTSSKESNNINEKSEIHDGDTDSSEDECNRDPTNRNYTESGLELKNIIKKSTKQDNIHFEQPTWKKSSTPTRIASPAAILKPNGTQLKPGFFSSVVAKSKTNDVYADPFFGIRIVTPLISSQVMEEKMAGKTAVQFRKLEKYLQTCDKSSDWVVAGVIVSKYTKTSQKGKPYTCWTISDLQEDLKTVAVFLFGKAYKELWKTSTHVVVAILNPSPLENKSSSSHIAALSVLNSDQVMIWGQSKDLGVCKARKKNGDPCTSFVNKHQCEFCVYHVRQEYRKFTGRSELQASCGGGLTKLKNKVLGKNEVFYAGRSFTAVQAKPTKKQTVKNKKRLNQLFNNCESRFGPESLPMTKTSSVSVQSSRVQRMKDAERLQKLTGSPATLSSLGLEGRDTTKEKQSPINKSIKNVLLQKEGLVKKEEKNNPFQGLTLNKIDKTCEPKLEETKQPQYKHKSSIKKFDTKMTDIISGNKSDKNNKKKQPTKNRFDNLTKLTSISKKISDSEKTVITSKHGGSPHELKSINMFDVSFEFDDERENKRLSFDKSHSTKANKSLIKENSTNKSLENLSCGIEGNSPHERKTPSNVCESTTFNKNTIFAEKTPIKPLSKKISPTSSKSNHNTFSEEKTKISVNTSLNDHYESSVPINNKKSVSPYQNQNPLSERKINANTYDSNTHAKVDQSLKKKVQSKIEIKSNVSISSPECQTKRLQDLVHNNSPKLGQFNTLSLTVPMPHLSKAKVNALKYVNRNGPIRKEDPKSKKERGELHKRKLLDVEDEKEEETFLSNRFNELMKATSRHQDLISNAENEAIDDYYDKMEKKEKMEEKMLTTYKVDCKAFKCLKCKYKWFSPSDLCKSENHPIKVVSAVKRFFQCHDCKNRTVSLELIPLHNCYNCGRSNWERAPMMKERKSVAVHLSIRGGEQKFMNSVITDTNLDLLVPDDS